MTAKTGLLVATAALGIAACAGPKVEVRQIASPIHQGDMAVADRLAEAAGQMRLGNVGLAIESYRKALRKSPRSALAHVGIAGAYDRMGRYDLSLDHYQVALALRPDDPRMYAALAGSLKAQGRPVDAARVMAEAKARAMQGQEAVAENRAPAEFLGPPTAPELVAGSLNVVPRPIVAEPVTSGVTVRLPRPRLADVREEPTIRSDDLVAATGREVPVVDLVTKGRLVPTSRDLRPDGPSISSDAIRVASASIPVVELKTLEAASEARELPVGRRVAAPTLAAAPIAVNELKLDVPAVANLTAPREEIPLAPAPKYAMATTPLPVVNPGPAPIVRDVPLAMAEERRPTPSQPAVMLRAPRPALPKASLEPATKPKSARLERMTTGEVALVTTAKPAWESRPAYTSKVVERTPTSTTVQFTRARTEASSVMLVAAGGEVRLAERAREQLVSDGIRVADTGNSPTARARSVLFYPKGREEDAKALVARFGFRIAAQVGPVEVMTLHLGKDAQAALLGG